MAAVGLAGVIFAIMRQFANPPPRTMTREWQEKTNEYLKVGENLTHSHSHVYLSLSTDKWKIGAKSGTHLWYLFRRLQRKRNGSESAGQETMIS